MVELKVEGVFVVSGRFFQNKHSIPKNYNTSNNSASKDLFGVDIVEFVVEVGHLVSEFGVVGAMRAVLHIPASELKHAHQVGVVIFEVQVLVMLGQNACPLEKLLCF